MFPAFAPDNKHVYFCRSRYFGNYSPVAGRHAHDIDIFSADLTDDKVRQLTDEHFYTVSPLSVSADGKNLLFKTYGDSGSVLKLYSLKTPGSSKVTMQPQIAGAPIISGKPWPFFGDPFFLPDGRTIIFMAATEGRDIFDYDVYRMKLDGGSPERLTEGNGHASGVRPSPDGKVAIFSKWRLDGHKTPISNELYLLDLQTRAISPVKLSGLLNK